MPTPVQKNEDEQIAAVDVAGAKKVLAAPDQSGSGGGGGEPAEQNYGYGHA